MRLAAMNIPLQLLEQVGNLDLPSTTSGAGHSAGAGA